MKTITLVNADDVISKALQQYFYVEEGITDNVFIDWDRPKNNIGQITMLEDAIKAKSKVILFDRYLSLRKHEVDWLMRYKNVSLFEPCLITRLGFRYMPFWYKMYNFTEKELEKTVDLGIVKDSNRPNIVYEYGLPEHPNYDKLNMTIVFGSETEYSRGYLPDISKILFNKCVPLLPKKHKYYCLGFEGLVVNNRKDVDWCVNVLRLYDVLLEGIFDNIKKYFPEMLVEAVSNEIRRFLHEGD